MTQIQQDAKESFKDRILRIFTAKRMDGRSELKE